MKAILPDGTEIQRSHLGQPYHGTSLTPDVVFSQGLTAKGDDRRLLEHVRGNKVSAFRGTTSVPTVSRHMRQAERAGVRINARRAKTRPMPGLGSREPTRRARKSWWAESIIACRVQARR